MKILASHQPNFFPYMGYFYKIFKSDIFVFSDDVHFTKGVYHNYTDIKNSNGKQRITVPVNSHSDIFGKIMIPEDGWKKKILKSLEQNYHNAEYFNEYFGEIQKIIESNEKNLCLLNIRSIEFICSVLGIQIDSILASSLGLRKRKDDRIIEMCKALGADEYYSGIGAKAYHIEENYLKNRIKLTYTDYQPSKYNQQYGDFIENLSSLDYIFNCGGKLPEGWKK